MVRRPDPAPADRSHRHAFAVSTDLTHAVQRAVELLGAEAIFDRSHVIDDPLPDHPGFAGELARECVTHVYRLLILLFIAAHGRELGVDLPGLAALRDGHDLQRTVERLCGEIRRGWPGPAIAPSRSPLFDPAITPILAATKFRDHVLQQVLALLSPARPRGQLSVAQLGAVYEGLLEYTGIHAREDTYEVQAADDPRVFYVPISRVAEFTASELRKDPAGRPIVHPRGSFLFRRAGRDRERSAAFYTPEVLTRCLTRYTLRERLGEPGEPGALTADEILDLTICEPAIGSGAFLDEAVRQLAHAYLERKQAETGATIPADRYPAELARVRYHFVDRRCYGVDLDPLAAELGKAALWLGALQPDLPPPSLDLRIRVGDSLIGARRDVYAAADLRGRAWLGKPPTRVPAGASRPAECVYHFLVPAAGMAPYDADAVIAALCPAEVAALRTWRRSVCRPFTPQEVTRLQAMSATIDALWSEHLRRREHALARSHQPLALWGRPAPREPRRAPTTADDPGDPGARIRAVMDQWCRLWSWPVERAHDLPSREAWLVHIEALLAHTPTAAPLPPDGQRYFHWELEFPEVFARGGFDVLLGNPPWLKLEWHESDILGELEPLLVIRKHSAKQVADRRAALMRPPADRALFLREFAAATGAQAFLGAPVNDPLLHGVQTNLYKSFITAALRLAAPDASIGMIHQKGLYDDPRGGALREQLHRRLRLHAHFINKLLLFPEVEDQKHYELSVLRGSPRPTIDFTKLSNVLHPSTIDGSHAHAGDGPVPGIKDDDGRWDLRPHRSRLVHIDDDALRLFSRLYDPPGTPYTEARLPVVHSREVVSALARFADAPRTIADLGDDYRCCEHFHETNQQKDGTIARGTRRPASAAEWVVSGPHFYIGTPLYKDPNEGCANNQDYAAIDLTQIAEDFLPRTNYSPACAPAEYRARTPGWRGAPITDHYRWAARKMISPTGERTLVAAILPRHAAHIDGVFSAVFAREQDLLDAAASSASIVADFFVKSTGKANLREDILRQLPLVGTPVARARALALHCLTRDYADLWDRNLPAQEHLRPSANCADPRCAGWEHAPRTWTWHAPLRTPYARRQALVELDALTALALHMTLDELQLLYRVQFPVLQQYERDTYYDRRGKIVFTVHKGLAGVGLDRKRWEQIKHADHGDRLPAWAADAGGPFVAPFDRCDRERDLARAYAWFAP